MNDWEVLEYEMGRENSRPIFDKFGRAISVDFGSGRSWIERASEADKYRVGKIHGEAGIDNPSLRQNPSYPNDKTYMIGWEDGRGNAELLKDEKR